MCVYIYIYIYIYIYMHRFIYIEVRQNYKGLMKEFHYVVDFSAQA